MNYKLIHSKTGKETMCLKVTIDDYDYYVSDNKIKKRGDKIIHKTLLNRVEIAPGEIGSTQEHYYKVILKRSVSERLEDDLFTEEDMIDFNNFCNIHFYRSYPSEIETEIYWSPKLAYIHIFENKQKTTKQILELFKQIRIKTVYYL